MVLGREARDMKWQRAIKKALLRESTAKAVYQHTSMASLALALLVAAASK